MEFLMIFAAAALYAVVRMTNDWLFQSFEISAQINWIYLPAFLRVFYVLVLGRVNGFLAIFFGGLMLGQATFSTPIHWLANNVGAALSPVLAFLIFEFWLRRPINLSSLRELLQVCLIYCLCNTLLHHLMWALLDTSQFHQPLQVLGMMMGDFLGCLIGVGVMKVAIDRFGLPKDRFGSSSQD
jgi:hypothetical protein